jgi:hypothetical protein
VGLALGVDDSERTRCEIKGADEISLAYQSAPFLDETAQFCGIM